MMSGHAVAAIHPEYLAGDEPGFVAEKEDDGRRDLVRPGEATHGNAAQQPLLFFAARRVRGPERLGLDRAGRYRVDGDVERSQFQGPGPRTGDQPLLGGAITGVAGRAQAEMA